MTDAGSTGKSGEAHPARGPGRGAVTVLAADRMLVSPACDEVVGGWVELSDGVIVAIGEGTPPSGAERLAGTLVPGFVDVHCHGGAGGAFDDGGFDAALDFHRAHGTTRTMLSLVTASIDVLEQRVARAADRADTDPLVLGIHLEGPFLHHDHRGAHDPALLAAPTPDAIDRLLAAGRGHVRMVTLAPELPGADAAIARLCAAGVIVAVGHTSADAAATHRAVDAGATAITHAFNGMRGLHHREPGPVLAAFDRDVTIEVIADGIHVDPRMVRLLFDAAPGRVALVTDAMQAAGLPDGPTRIGDLDAVVTGGVPRLVDAAGPGAIAGSTLTQDRAVQVVRGAGVPLATAVAAASSVPAAMLGRGDLGAIEVGRTGDLVLLGEDGTVQRVWAAGAALA